LRKDVSHELVERLTKEAVDIAAKQTRLHAIWPYIFIEMVKDAVLDMTDLDAYIRETGKEFEVAQ